MGVSIGLSIGALVVAVYAVVVSRQALAHQKQQDQARVTPTVRVELEHSADPQQVLLQWLGDPIPPTVLEYRITVSVVNDGQRAEHLKRLRFESADRSEGLDARPVGTDEEIPPRARHTNIVRLDEIPKWQEGFIAIATMAAGEEFSSPVEHADAELLAHIARHNEGAGG